MSEERDTARRRGPAAIGARVRGLLDLPPERKRQLRRRGIVSLALVIFVLVPGYLASQPGFMARYDHMAGAHETWEASVHASVRCQACHVDPGFFSQAGFGLTMLGEFYVSRVAPSREPDLLERPANEACSECHIDLRTVSPSGDLNIPHRAHVDVLEIACVDCHEFLVHEESPEGKHVPRMVMCMECHDGEQAKNACTTCHTEKAAPEDHQAADWLIIHPDQQDEVDCADCHAWTEDYCVECHSRRPVSHVDLWRTVHRDRVEERRNCEACHEADFCIRCHGEVPQLNYDPTLELVE